MNSQQQSPSWPATTRRSSPPRTSWSTAASRAHTSPPCSQTSSRNRRRRRGSACRSLSSMAIARSALDPRASLPGVSSPVLRFRPGRHLTSNLSALLPINVRQRCNGLIHPARLGPAQRLSRRCSKRRASAGQHSERSETCPAFDQSRQAPTASSPRIVTDCPAQLPPATPLTNATPDTPLLHQGSCG